MQSHLSLKSLIVAAGLVLSAALPAVLAMPHGGPRGGAGGPGAHLMEALDDVGASDAQRQQIRDIFRTAHEDLKAQHQQGQALRKQMTQAFAAPNVDANAVEALRKQQQALHEVASQRMSRAMVEAARVLSPEQRAKLAEKMNKRMERMQERQRERQQRHGRPS